MSEYLKDYLFMEDPNQSRWICMSVKPKYIMRILSGEKSIEFRKNEPKKMPKRILFYCSAPISQFVGTATLHDIVKSKAYSPPQVRSKHEFDSSHNFYPGVTQYEHDEYYGNAEFQFEFLIKDIFFFLKRINKFEIDFIHPPQSWSYINEVNVRKLIHVLDNTHKIGVKVRKSSYHKE